VISIMFLKNKKEIKLNSTPRGFTLIETMVAISILLMSMTSPIIIAKQGMVSARQARNSITAFYMAQDAIEYIKNVRDSNFLNGQSWLTNFGPCIDNFCQVDTLDDDFTTAFSSCDAINGCPVINKLTDINGNFTFYDYNTDYPSSGFVRNVKIVTINSDEVRVEVKILWDKEKRNFSVAEILKRLVVD